MNYFSYIKNCLVFFISLFISCNKISHSSDLNIKNGILQATDFNFENNGLIRLEGNVEFYWKKLLEPSDFSSNDKPVSDGYIKIPGVWNGFKVSDTVLRGEGYATCRFLIKVNKDDWYGIKIKEFDCAYKIWVEGHLVDSVGKAGTNYQSTTPGWQRKEIYFNSNGKEIEVIIQIANFHHRLGGPEDIMLFGLGKDIYGYKQLLFGLDIFLFGVLLIMCVFHFFIYLFRKKEITVLLFSLLCFFMVLRLITTSEKIITGILPSINWDFAVRIEYISCTLLLPLFLGFIYTYYPKDFSKTVLKIISIIAAIFTIFYTVTPVKIFSYTPLYYLVLIAACGIYLLAGLIVAQIKKRDNALVFLSGYLFFLVTLTNDILYYNKIINTSFLMPYGLSAMVFSQAYAISRRLFIAFNEVENLTEKVDKYTRELEEIVKERTSEIDQQKEEIELQADALVRINDELIDLANFKETMTNMVVHDMKNLLNNIILLSEVNEKESKSDYLGPMRVINQSARQILNLVLNILDIQRFEEAKLILKPQKTTIYNIINNATKSVEISAFQKNLTIENKCSKEIMLNVDAELIERVFINLLSNAIRFSGMNSKVTVKCQPFDNSVKCSVIDEGKGIPPELTNLVFEKFKSLGKEEMGKVKSSGLGLTFCKLAVEAHKGEIGIESLLNKGTEIWFTLPVGKSAEVNIIDENKTAEYFVDQRKLSDHDIKILRQFCEKLNKIKYYEVSAINDVLNDLADSNSEGIKEWIKIIKKAVFYGKEEAYLKQIDLVLKIP